MRKPQFSPVTEFPANSDPSFVVFSLQAEDVPIKIARIPRRDDREQ
jgi:hypothetical protein